MSDCTETTILHESWLDWHLSNELVQMRVFFFIAITKNGRQKFSLPPPEIQFIFPKSLNSRLRFSAPRFAGSSCRNRKPPESLFCSFASALWPPDSAVGRWRRWHLRSGRTEQCSMRGSSGCSPSVPPPLGRGSKSPGVLFSTILSHGITKCNTLCNA